MLVLLVIELAKKVVDLDLLSLERVLELRKLPVVLGDERGRVCRLVTRGIVGAFIGELKIPPKAVELLLLALRGSNEVNFSEYLV